MHSMNSPHCPWFFTGVVLLRQSIDSGNGDASDDGDDT